MKSEKHEIQTMIGRITLLVEDFPATYWSTGFERVLIEVGPGSGEYNRMTHQQQLMRMSNPKLEAPELTDEEGWEWE